MSRGVKHIQKSFSRGILSPHCILREDIKGYDESARDLFNVLVGRQGEAYRRGGTTLVEKLPQDVLRIIPFTYTHRQYLIIFVKGSAEILSSQSPSKVPYEKIKVVEVTDYNINFKGENFSPNDFSNAQNVRIYEKGNESVELFDSYARDVEEGYGDEELASMDYAQIGNLIVFVNDSFPPFYIRREGEEFVFYRNGIDLVINGDGERLVEESALYTLPFSFYGFSIRLLRYDRNKRSYGYSFEARLLAEGSYDKEGLGRDNLNFWRNRAFVVSGKRDVNGNQEISVFGGIIREIINDSANRESGSYILRGEFVLDDPTILDAMERESATVQTNLFICDWTEEVGWPRSVTTFENRFVFGGNAAYPSKIWFSSQPSVQRIQIGTLTKVSPKTDTQLEERRTEPIFKVAYFHQTDLFNKDSTLLGLTIQNTASAGSYFVNDDLGLDIQWVKGGEVLFIGTNRGIFASRGTEAGASNPIPFNTGFQDTDSVPVKRVFPVLVGKILYYISKDNSVYAMAYNSRTGYAAIPIDSFSRETVRDASFYSSIQRRLRKYSYGVTNPVIEGRNNTVNLERANKDTLLRVINYRHSNDKQEQQYAFSLYSFLDERGSTGRNRVSFNCIFYSPLINGPYYGSPSSREVFENINGANINSNDLPDSFFEGIYGNKKDLKGENFESANLDFFISSLMISNAVITRKDRRDNSIEEYHDIRSDISIGVLIRDSTEVDIPQGISFNRVQGISPHSVETAEYNINISSQFKDNPATAYVNPNRHNLGVLPKITSWIKGEIDNGYVLPSEGVQGQRICGVEYRGSRALRLTFSKNSMPVSIGKMRIKQNNTIVLEQAIPGNFAIPEVANNTDFSTDGISVYRLDLNTSADLADANSSYTIELLGEMDRVLNTIQIKVVKEGSSNSQMRDSLDNKYSGRFKQGAIVIKGSNDSIPSFLYVDRQDNINNIDVALRQLDSTVAGEQTFYNWLQGKLSFNSFSLDFLLSTQAEAPNEAFSLQEQLQFEENKNYPVFSPDSKMLYDWVKKSLFIFRGDGNYLAFTHDLESRVVAWNRGFIPEFKHPVYLNDLRYSPPERHPGIFGFGEDKVYMHTEGLYSRKQLYLEGLPNCLDRHVILEISSNMLNLTQLKNSLVSLGYSANSLITIATKKNNVIVHKKVLSSLSGSMGVEDNRHFIVGVNIPYTLSLWPPMIRTREFQSLRGMQYAFRQLIFYMMFDTVFNINGKPATVNKDSLQFNEDFGDGILPTEYMASTEVSYDPILKITGDSPFPLAMAGYIADLDVGG